MGTGRKRRSDYDVSREPVTHRFGRVLGRPRVWEGTRWGILLWASLGRPSRRERVPKRGVCAARGGVLSLSKPSFFGVRPASPREDARPSRQWSSRRRTHRQRANRRGERTARRSPNGSIWTPVATHVRSTRPPGRASSPRGRSRRRHPRHRLASCHHPSSCKLAVARSSSRKSHRHRRLSCCQWVPARWDPASSSWRQSSPQTRIRLRARHSNL